MGGEGGWGGRGEGGGGWGEGGWGQESNFIDCCTDVIERSDCGLTKFWRGKDNKICGVNKMGHF